MQWNPATGRIEDTDQIRRKLLRIVEDFLRMHQFDHFQYLDDYAHLGYDQVVESSMDLDLLYHMMSEGMYCTVEEFIDAVLRIVRNVKKFEPLAELYTTEADELEAELGKRIHRVPEWSHLSPGDFESTVKEVEPEAEKN